jgi:hypothetical protein
LASGLYTPRTSTPCVSASRNRLTAWILAWRALTSVGTARLRMSGRGPATRGSVLRVSSKPGSCREGIRSPATRISVRVSWRRLERLREIRIRADCLGLACLGV